MVEISAITIELISGLQERAVVEPALEQRLVVVEGEVGGDEARRRRSSPAAFSDSESSQSTGISAKSDAPRTIADAPERVLAGSALHLSLPVSLPRIVRRRSRCTKTNAISRTQRKISTETAEPSPRLSREISWL